MLMNKYRAKIEEQIDIKQREAEYLEVFFYFFILENFRHNWVFWILEFETFWKQFFKKRMNL